MWPRTASARAFKRSSRLSCLRSPQSGINGPRYCIPSPLGGERRTRIGPHRLCTCGRIAVVSFPWRTRSNRTDFPVVYSTAASHSGRWNAVANGD